MNLKTIEIPKTIMELEDEAEILGIIIGDGSIQHGGYDIRLQVREKDFAENFANLIKKTYGLNVSLTYPKYYCVYVCTKKLCRRIIKLTANNKVIPQHIFLGTEEIKARFIRGFSDSEGSVDNLYNRRQIVITQKNLEVLEGLQKLLLDLGITSTIYIKKYDSNKLIISLLDNLKTYSQKVGFSISYKKDALEKIIKYLEERGISSNEELYWKVLMYELTRKESLRKAAKNFNISVETYRSWIQGKKIPNKIKQNLALSFVPENYETIQEQYLFLPVIPVTISKSIQCPTCKSNVYTTNRLHWS